MKMVNVSGFTIPIQTQDSCYVCYPSEGYLADSITVAAIARTQCAITVPLHIGGRRPKN